MNPWKMYFLRDDEWKNEEKELIKIELNLDKKFNFEDFLTDTELALNI